MTIKKYITVIIVSFISFTAFSLPNVSPLTDRLNHIRSMQANFVQLLFDNKGQVVQRTRGYMAFVRPNKFRWYIQTPTPQLIIADGKTLWFYDTALQQVTQKSIVNQSQSSPAALLSGSVATFKKDFILKQMTTAGDTTTFQLIPRNKNAGFGWVKLQFSKNNLTGMQFTDNLGQLSQILFNKVVINSPLPPGLFQFKPPKGVDVIKD